MTEPEQRRSSASQHTRLEALIRERNLSFEEAADLVCATINDREGVGLTLTPRHLSRIARRERESARPTPIVRRALEMTFEAPVDDLLAPPHDLVTDSPSKQTDSTEVLSVAADRARQFMFLDTATPEGTEMLGDEVRELVRAYPVVPLPRLLGNLTATQSCVFSLLERPQRAKQAVPLYFLAGVLCGTMAKASHDLGDSAAATTQLRTAWLCADQADHDGLRTWVAGMHALVSYWADRPLESIRHVERGAIYGERARNSAAVWLASSEARARGALGDSEGAKRAIARADELRDCLRLDDVDELGGLAVFGRSRQTYFAAEALVWLSPQDATEAARVSHDAVQNYLDPADPDYAFGDAAGSRANLAIARTALNDQEGAVAAMAPVLELNPDQRLNGVVQSVNRVRSALLRCELGASGRELLAALENFTRDDLRSIER